MKELKPCPFCGAKEHDLDFRLSYATKFTKPFLMVECLKCGGMMVDTNMEHCLNDVKKAWNRRANTTEGIQMDEKMNKDIIGKSFQEWEERDAKKLDVGGRIAKILCERKMTQRELAQKCHITEVSMSRYINNSRMPKGTAIVAMAKALGVSADYLLGLSDMRGDSDD